MDYSMWNEAVRELEQKNYARARALLQPLVDNKDAQLQLGYLYQEGLGGEANAKRARDIYQSLADEGDSQGTYFLAKSFLSSHQLPEAVRAFEKAAELANVSGAFWAAALHGGLLGNVKDEKKHRLFLERAASLGHIFAKRDLALADARSTTSLLKWCAARVRYLRAIFEGIVVMCRDRYDFRIR